MPDAIRCPRQQPLVRPARPGEYAAIGSLLTQTYLEEGWASTRQAHVLQNTAARAEQATVLVAVDRNRLLGTVTLSYPESRAEPTIDRPTVSLLVVAPHARGQGVGRALVVACIRRATLFGFLHIQLSVTEDMTAARGLVERLGFVLTPLDDPWGSTRRRARLTYKRDLHPAVHPSPAGANVDVPATGRVALRRPGR